MRARRFPHFCCPAFLISPAFIPGIANAAETAGISAAGSAVQVIFGLIMVLGVMMLIAWLFKRYAPGIGQDNSVARIVGGVSVGNRERVLVIEVTDRWLVVGVSPSQVTSIANLEAGQATTAQLNQRSSATHPFAKWLTQSMNRTQPINPSEGK
ncbi:MAG: flagellar biosynthetic protein FliO [Betaproteobacteria bacterium HGW-Betaproteobacteria-2]|nr:MAG: flagellar biosynthetic protein FliO [Betaproteobacteria bacterium HGW-Betaproteobacteria-2]